MTSALRSMPVKGIVLAQHLAPPSLRIALALPFLRSGLTRWEGFLSISPVTQFLFETQFQVHFLGHAYGIPYPDTAALAVALAELGFPLLLLIGAATRLAALALLMMTAVIQLVVPDGWANFHLYWAVIATSIIGFGPGHLSVDYWVARRSSGVFGGRAVSRAFKR